MHDLRFYDPFNNIIVKSGRWRTIMKAVCNGNSFTVGKISPRAGSTSRYQEFRVVSPEVTVNLSR